MLRRCASPKPVLTTYPLPYEGSGSAVTLSAETHTTLLCTRDAKHAYGADGMLRFRARLLAKSPPAPLPTAFWAAGFSFSSATLVRDVPYDPHLPFLFFGEEISVAVRMWTRGYDLFAPDAHVLFHLWQRSYRTTFWQIEGGEELKRRSQARIRRLLTGAPLVDAEGAPPPPLAYTATDADADADHAAEAAAAGKMTTVGEEWAEAEEAARQAPGPADPIWTVGSVRSLSMYEAYAGVSFGPKRVSPQAERGGMPSEACFWDRFACLDAMLAGGEAGAAAEPTAAKEPVPIK